MSLTTGTLAARHMLRLSWEEAFRWAALDQEGADLCWPVLRAASKSCRQIGATEFRWLNGGLEDESVSRAQIIRGGDVSPTRALAKTLGLIEESIVYGRSHGYPVRKMAGLRELTGRTEPLLTDALSLCELRSICILSAREENPGEEPRLYEALWEGGLQVVTKAAYPEGAVL